MNPLKLDNDAERLGAFVDGELDLPGQLAMEAQAEQDEALRARIDELQRSRRAVREGATYHAAPDALRRRLADLAPRTAGAPLAPDAAEGRRAHAAPDVPAPAQPGTRRPAGGGIAGWLQGWLGWRPAATVLAGVLALGVAINVAWLQSLESGRTADEVVTSHVRATLGQRLVDVASSDHHTVKPWLSAHLDYSPPVAEPKGSGAALLGGRVDYVDGRPVAALVYRQGQHVVTSFLWPTAGGSSEPAFARQRGFETAHWVAGGMTHWVVSDLNPTEFRGFVGEVRELEGTR
jgi:anti-sigma factor RsiW